MQETLELNVENKGWTLIGLLEVLAIQLSRQKLEEVFNLTIIDSNNLSTLTVSLDPTVPVPTPDPVPDPEPGGPSQSEI